MLERKSQRGIRLTPEERIKLADWWRQGLSIGEIAQALGRHRETVAKYIQALESPEDVESLRREALKEAQVSHWRSLREAAGALRGKFLVSDHPRDIPAGWEEALREPQDQKYLVQTLKEVHAPDHLVWKALASWSRHVQSLRSAYQGAEGWFGEHLDVSVVWEGLGDQSLGPVVGHWLSEVRGDRPQVPQVTKFGEAGGFALYLGNSRLTVGSREDMDQAEKLWVTWRTEASSCSFTVKARKDYQALREMEPQVKELVDRLGLIEAFPGVCEFCPLRTVVGRKNLRRRGGRK